MNNDDTNNATPNPTPKPAPSPLGQKKVFDVVRPGKAPASATSRPVIVGHKPQVKDDQIVNDKDSNMADDNPLDDSRTLMSHKGGLKLKAPESVPTEEAEPAKPEMPAQEEQGSTAPEAMPPAPETPEAAMPPAPAEPEQPDIALSPAADTTDSENPPFPAESTKSEQSPAKETEVPEVFTMDRPAKTEQSESPADGSSPDGTDSEHAAITTEELIAATGAPTLDHAIISHHKAKVPWWEWVLIFLLIVVVGLVAFNFLLDAEVIKLNMSIPHTNLIK